MSDQSSHEQITLHSSDIPDVRPRESQLQQVTAELLQKSSLREIQRLIRVFDKRFIKIIEKTPKGTKEYLINTIILSSKPSRKLGLNPLHLLLSFAMGYASYYSPQLKNLELSFLTVSYIYVIMILLATASLVFFILFLRSFKFVWQFKSRNGKVAVFDIFRTKPSRSAVRKFVKQLSENIKQVNSNNHMNDVQNLAVELNEHRRLRDEGLVNNKGYEKAKARIMGHHSKAGRQPADTLH